MSKMTNMSNINSQKDKNKSTNESEIDPDESTNVQNDLKTLNLYTITKQIHLKLQNHFLTR